MTELPEKIETGGELDVQLAPLGDFPNRGTVQHIDAEAVQALVRAFSGEVLVDADHESENGGSTEAMAWIVALHDGGERGLVGTFRFTDAGAAAVTGRRYRFVSPAWTLDGIGVPNGIVSALKKRAEELEGCAKEKAADEFAAANADKCAPAALKNAYLRDPALLDKDRRPVYWLYRCVQSHDPAALPSPLLLVSALLFSLRSMSNLSLSFSLPCVVRKSKMFTFCMEANMDKIIELILNAKGCAVFTGAGVSTLCGIPDFRGPQGLYKQKDAERIFDIDWFQRDPSIYYKGCRELVYGLRNYKPGPVHIAIARLEKAGIVKGVITQNIDMLHQKAGSKIVYEVHGSPLLHHCFGCGREKTFDEICKMLETNEVARCEVCGQAYKPNITFFGEMLPEAAFNGAVALAESADLMLVLGSSLTVQPAASIPPFTLRHGGKIIIVNGQPTPLDRMAWVTLPDLKVFADAVNEALDKAGK